MGGKFHSLTKRGPTTMAMITEGIDEERLRILKEQQDKESDEESPEPKSTNDE